MMSEYSRLDAINQLNHFYIIDVCLFVMINDSLLSSVCAGRFIGWRVKHDFCILKD